ncbi:MAG: diguanylate cyclase, partial [Gammaproteobacteria bacterium]|nr:diguanylate cyclase [Gammaproteobacteria bacterium]
LVVSSPARQAGGIVDVLLRSDFEVEIAAALPADLARLDLHRWAAIVLHVRTTDLALEATIAALRRAAPVLAVVVYGVERAECRSRVPSTSGAQAFVTDRDMSAGQVPRIMRDAIARARCQAAESAPARLARDVLAAIADGVLSADRLGRVTYLNAVAATLTGWALDDAVGRRVEEVLVIIDERTRLRVPDLLGRAMREDRRVEPQPGAVLLNRHGHEYFVDQVAAPIRDGGGHVVGAVGTFRDVGKQRMAARHLAHRAQHDVLTDLPNRALLAERANNAIVLARRHGRMVALLYVDLDGFKCINDTYGHWVGDQLLVSTAQRMVDGVRASDTVSRQGGDEFVILLSEVDCVEDAVGSARKLLANLAPAHRLGRRHLSSSASIGISVYPAHGTTFAALLSQADAAMYAAKRAGGNTFRLADEGRHTMYLARTEAHDE